MWSGPANPGTALSGTVACGQYLSEVYMSKMQEHYDVVYSYLSTNPNSTVAQIAQGTTLAVGIVKAVLYANQQTAFEKTGVGGRHSPHRWLLREAAQAPSTAGV